MRTRYEDWDLGYGVLENQGGGGCQKSAECWVLTLLHALSLAGFAPNRSMYIFL